ncbi:hypothetical protein L7F22_017758 [Adiantum nelumboides]|nr:hypothetical protein [Adiantum nelumboides]
MDPFSSSKNGSSLSPSPAAVAQEVQNQVAQMYLEQLLKTVGDKCFTKCVTKPSSSLGSSESSCVSRPDCKPLSMWPGMYHSPPIIDGLWKARSSICERLWPPPSLAGPPQQTLITRTPEDSRISIVYDFTSDYILRKQYRSAWDECYSGALRKE